MVRDETFLYHVLMVCLTVLRQIKVEMKAVQEVKEVQTLQFRNQHQSLQTGIKNALISPQPAIALKKQTNKFIDINQQYQHTKKIMIIYKRNKN